MKLTKNFWEHEFYCRGKPFPEELAGNIMMAACAFQILRDYTGRPIHINSGWRSPEVNEEVDGYPGSKHLYGTAGDLVAEGIAPVEFFGIVLAKIEAEELPMGGVGMYWSHTHYDVGRSRVVTWDAREP